MKLSYLFSYLILLGSQISISQTEQTDYWNDLLLNNRANALSLVNEAHDSNPSMETLLSREVIKNSSGKFEHSPNFLTEYLSYNQEEYIFPLWNQSYFFGDYISGGFEKRTMETVKRFQVPQFKNQSLKESLIYLKAIAARDQGDFVTYQMFNRKMSTITNWQYCGVFENLNGSGLDAIYGPEEFSVSETDFDANSNGKVNWYVPNAPDYDGYMMFTNHREYGSGVHYAQTFFNNPSERKALVKVGCSAKFKIWLNDVLIYENSKEAGTDVDAYTVEVNLPAGASRILVKVADNSSAYMSMRVTDEAGVSFSDIEYSNQAANYQKSTLEQLSPINHESYFVTYFSNLRKQNPTNFLYDYLLIHTYLRSQNFEKAKEILLPLYEVYPKSTMLRKLLISVYSLEEDSDSVEEMVENIQSDDESSYLALTYKFQDVQELFRSSMVEMQTFLETYADATDSEVLKISTKLILALRQEDVVGLKTHLDDLIDYSLENNQVRLAKIYIPLYGTVLNDEYKSIKMLEKLNKKYFDYDVRQRLISFYARTNRTEKALKLLRLNVEQVDNELFPLRNISGYLQSLQRYKEALVYIDKALELFPYSFYSMEAKADALLQMGRKEEAIEWYNKSLIYNSSNSSIRKKIIDLNEDLDIVEEYKTQKVYTYIKENRNKIESNNYGYNILLDEAIIELYEEAGGKGRYTMIYEVTDETGVENLKEYNLGLYGNYDIIKSEIVKADHSIVPADRSGSSLVFGNLEVGDAIYIDYESSFSGYGRFYRDFVDNYQFDGYHPIIRSTYKLITPKSREINFTLVNGEVSYQREEKGDQIIYSWELIDIDGFEQTEDYMPTMSDCAQTLYISTIDSWEDIATWYSDLVRSQQIINSDVQSVYDELFPESDVSTIPEEDRAKRIYFYLADNMNYSSVSFRQSGFIPQKPSKTLNTELGDCKDFSTLFVGLARMAKLDANLALVLTSNHGKTLVLPSTDFNHCIAKVVIDGSEQFLELTNKNLPFGALPTSLRGASILEIPEDISNDNLEVQLMNKRKMKRVENRIDNDVTINISEESNNMTINTSISGASRSYVAQILEGPSYELMLEDVSDNFHSSMGSHIIIDSLYNIVNDIRKDTLSYTSTFTITGKVKKIGSFRILEIPTVLHAYTNNVIAEKERNYPIEYLKYESVDVYNTSYNIILDGMEFTEIPEDVSLTYKSHTYSRTYTEIAPNHLLLTVKAIPDDAIISTEEYEEFKEYVQAILDSKDEFIGYK